MLTPIMRPIMQPVLVPVDYEYGDVLNPLSLFAAGEQGAWYDPSDFSTLYQDAAGTTPVTALGQPVGLMLDKRLGAVRGPELILNGDFTSATGWALSDEVSISGGSLNFNTTTTRTATATGASCVSGRWYEVSFNLTSFTSGIPRFDSGGGTTNISTTVGAKRFIRQSTGTNDFLFTCSSSGAVYSVDNVSVRELPGNHAYQTTAPSRPTVEARVNLLTKSEQFNDAAWAKELGSITSTASLAPDGTSTAAVYTETGTSGVHGIRNAAALITTVGQSTTASIRLKKSTRRYAFFSLFDGSIYRTVVIDFDTATVTDTNTPGITYSLSPISNGFLLVSITRTQINTSNTYAFVGTSNSPTPTYDVNGRPTFMGSASESLIVWGADLRLASDSAYPYQRVNTATDYADIGAPRYLSFDGTDDGMATPSINFTGTDKMSVWAGVRKNADASTGALIELSAQSTGAVNPGSFGIFAPRSAAAAEYSFLLCGSTVTSYSATSFAAPITNVLSVAYDIAGATRADEVNPRVNRAIPTLTGADSANAGTGNFGNYPLYIGRRGGTSLPFNGRLYGLIVRGAASSDGQIAAGEAWVNAKTRAY